LAAPAGWLARGAPFSAHPKRDPQTRSIFNFGVSLSYPQGRLQQQGSYQIGGMPFVHDRVLCGRYRVFLVPPVRIALLPILLGRIKRYFPFY
jgi:all-trans-8'-apo-beta-carotenal 15,15'-oxygenase